MKYPANQIEFDDMFNTEQDCIGYLSLIRRSNGFECPQCGSIRYWGKNKLEYYLDEYVFGYNRRTSNSRGLLFR